MKLWFWRIIYGIYYLQGAIKQNEGLPFDEKYFF